MVRVEPLACDEAKLESGERVRGSAARVITDATLPTRRPGSRDLEGRDDPTEGVLVRHISSP